MLDTELRSLVQGFRARAAEILLRAETMHDVDVCLKLREIAASYERLARRIEQRGVCSPKRQRRNVRHASAPLAAGTCGWGWCFGCNVENKGPITTSGAFFIR